MQYRFSDEQTAIDAEQWLCYKANELGMPFSGTTNRWAIPTEEREPLPQDSAMDALGEPTGYWLFPCVPDDVIECAPDQTAMEFLNLFQPEII